MVKKLLKYDFSALFKYLLAVYAIVLGTAGLNRLLQLFEAEDTWFGIVFTSSVVLLVLGILSMLILTMIIIQVRFYRNLFSNEGYLTFTLPATVDEQLWSKIIAGVVTMLCSFLVIFGALCIVFSGEVLHEIFKAGAFLIAKVAEELKPVNVALLGVEYFILFILTAADTVMLFYTCLTLGQLSKKHRVGTAVGIFFGQYFFFQILMTVMIIVYSINDWEFIELLFEALEKHTAPTLHAINGVLFFVEVLLFVLYYFLMRHVLKKKLNLE